MLLALLEPLALFDSANWNLLIQNCYFFFCSFFFDKATNLELELVYHSAWWSTELIISVKWYYYWLLLFSYIDFLVESLARIALSRNDIKGSRYSYWWRLFFSLFFFFFYFFQESMSRLTSNDLLISSQQHARRPIPYLTRLFINLNCLFHYSFWFASIESNRRTLKRQFFLESKFIHFQCHLDYYSSPAKC